MSAFQRYQRRVVIAGGTGFVGTALSARLKQQGYGVTLLSRQPGAGKVPWDGVYVGDWQKALEGAWGLINLSGAPITLKWTDENKSRIVNSRVQSTLALAKALEMTELKPKVWLNASAVGIYGDRGDEIVDEASPLGVGGDFMVDCCEEWEASFFGGPAQTRKVAVRTGVVLGREGGAYPILSRLVKCFLGGAVGSGRQYMSWIHIEDLARLIQFAIESPIQGPINGTAPNPVTNSQLMATLRRSFGRPWVPPVPAVALKLMTALGGPESTPLLQGQRVIPAQLLGHGFEFLFEELASAFEALRDQ